MLTASPSTATDREAAGPAAIAVCVRRRSAVDVRRRRSVLRMRRRRSAAVLAAVLVAVVVASALTGSAAAWSIAAVVAALAIAYTVLLLRVRHLATEREMSVAFARDASFDWAGFEHDLAEEAGRSADHSPDEVPFGPVDLGPADLGRFIVSYALGWVLTPLVAVVRLAGGDLTDLDRHRVIERLVRAQQAGRSQSLRLLAAGVVATAGVTAVGSLAGVASASPAISTSASGATVTVQAGQTLGSIAASYGTTASALASANGIANPNLIFPGQQLTVPGGASGATTSASGTYTVAAGDTLSSIAAQFGTTSANLAALNDISDPNLIYVGEVLQVSGTASGDTATATSSASASGSYTVEAGDTLASIAAQFGTTSANLAGLNDISDPNLIYVGEVLQVDGTAPASSTATASPSPPPTPVAPADGESAAAATAVKVALEQVGKPYVYGGAGPDDFDCSGLVMYAYEAAGIDLPHYSVSQYDDTTRISESQLEPGDLVFYDNYSGPQPGHVAMYIGNGDVVAANETGTNVQTQSLSYDGTIIGFGRVT